MLQTRRSFVQMLGLAGLSASALGLAGCSQKSSTDQGVDAGQESASLAGDDVHDPITICLPYLYSSNFVALVRETYPEINLQVIPYGGANTSAFLDDMVKAGDLPDICTLTQYSPDVLDVSDKMLDLSGYAFTDNYVESRLRDVVANGAIYLLPSHYSCLGITYNKTLLERHGWSVPTSLNELEELAEKAAQADVQLCLDQLQYPGYGFQYLCNIADTDFLGTLEGRQWQRDFLAGKATLAGTPGMMEAMGLVERWRDNGMLNDLATDDDALTRATMLEGNTLFMLGSSNGFSKASDNGDEFGLMPYLSVDGTQNVFILTVGRYYGLNKRLGQAGNERKLADALHVIELLSSVEGINSLLSEDTRIQVLQPLRDYRPAESSYYNDIADDLNAGHTVPFIYAGWENGLVPMGNSMISFIRGEKQIEDVVRDVDAAQDAIVNNSPEVYTTVTEKIETRGCTWLLGRAFAQATGIDVALLSETAVLEGLDGSDQNKDGVSGCLFALPMTDYEITTILPVNIGWSGTLKTVTLTGARLEELEKLGYDREGLGEGNTYPYVLVKPESLELKPDKTYTAVISGATDAVLAEGDAQQSDVVGLEAAKEFFSGFESLSNAEVAWK